MTLLGKTHVMLNNAWLALSDAQFSQDCFTIFGAKLLIAAEDQQRQRNIRPACVVD